MQNILSRAILTQEPLAELWGLSFRDAAQQRVGDSPTMRLGCESFQKKLHSFPYFISGGDFHALHDGQQARNRTAAQVTCTEEKQTSPDMGGRTQSHPSAIPARLPASAVSWEPEEPSHEISCNTQSPGDPPAQQPHKHVRRPRPSSFSRCPRFRTTPCPRTAFGGGAGGPRAVQDRRGCVCTAEQRAQPCHSLAAPRQGPAPLCPLLNVGQATR